MSFVEWLGRTLAVTLSLMVTLSIIGAIASIPSGNVGSRLVREQPTVVLPDPDQPILEPTAQPAPEPGSEPEGPAGEVVASAAADPEAETDVARWLEAITFALLAIAGLMALGVLILFRALIHLSRLRERSET